MPPACISIRSMARSIGKAKDETAWNCRDATWSMVIAGVGSDPGKAPALKKWAKDYWEAVHPFDLGGAYPNFMMDDEGEARLKATYGDNYKRLGKLKKKYDPANLFRVNQNIRPARLPTQPCSGGVPIPQNPRRRTSSGRPPFLSGLLRFNSRPDLFDHGGWGASVRTTSKAALLATLCGCGWCSCGAAVAPGYRDMADQSLGNIIAGTARDGLRGACRSGQVRRIGKMDSLLVTRHGSIVAEAYYAPFRSGHRHRINSATKAVTGTLIAIALKNGLLDSLDHRVLEFFPDRTIAHLDDNKQAMTIRHLLNMTSGLEWTERLDDSIPVSFLAMEQSRDWQQFILDQPMAQQPGTAFEYNSGNSHLLSAIINRLTGSALDYAKAQLFGPLGITDLFWRQDPQRIPTGGAGLYLQPRDMAKIGYLYLRNGSWDGRQNPAAGLDRRRQSCLGRHASETRAGFALCQFVLGPARQACLYGGRLSPAAHRGDA